MRQAEVLEKIFKIMILKNMIALTSNELKGDRTKCLWGPIDDYHFWVLYSQRVSILSMKPKTWERLLAY